MTVLDADEYNQVFIKIYPSNALTNPGLKDMTPTLPITIAMELKAKAISNGVAPGVFQKYGAIPVPGRRNHFLMAVEDEAAGYEIVSAVQGRIRCIPDEPKDPQQRFDQFEYDYHVEMYVEEEGYSALPPKNPHHPTLSEELSITIKLNDCEFHHQFDKTHIARPWREAGWQVMHIYSIL